MNLTPAMMTALQSGVAHPRWMIWLEAKNRVNGQKEASGLWSGLHDITLTIDGKQRTYKGAGGLLQIDGISSRIGLNIESQEISLSMHEKEVIELIRGYDPSFCEALIHLMLVNDAEETIGIARVFKGTVDGIDLTETEADYTAKVKLVSSMRFGSKPLFLKQADSFTRSRNPNDRGREYSSATGQNIWWGDKRGTMDTRWYGSVRTSLSSLNR